MDAVSPMVIVLLLTAVAVAVLFVLTAIGRLPLSMEPPEKNRWERRRDLRRGRRDRRRDQGPRRPES